MSDDKPNPVDDLKQGLGLLFRAAKGAVEKIPTDKVEDAAKDAAKEVARAFETLGQEVEKIVAPKKASQPPPTSQAQESGGANANANANATNPEPPKFDDAYAPEPPKKS